MFFLVCFRKVDKMITFFYPYLGRRRSSERDSRGGAGGHNINRSSWLEHRFYKHILQVRAEQLRNEIRGVKTTLPSLSDEELEQQHKRKVEASSELVQLYKSLRTNMEEALTHRRDTLAKRDMELKNLINEMEKKKENLAGDQVGRWRAWMIFFLRVMISYPHFLETFDEPMAGVSPVAKG